MSLFSYCIFLQLFPLVRCRAITKKLRTHPVDLGTKFSVFKVTELGMNLKSPNCVNYSSLLRLRSKEISAKFGAQTFRNYLINYLSNNSQIFRKAFCGKIDITVCWYHQIVSCNLITLCIPYQKHMISWTANLLTQFLNLQSEMCQ